MESRTGDTRSQATWGTRLRFLTRALGSTGLFALCVGVAIALPVVEPHARTAYQNLTWKKIPELFQSSEPWKPLLATWETASRGELGTLIQVGVILIACGLVAVTVELLRILFTGVMGLFLTARRRTAVGINGQIQTALAIALVLVANAVSLDLFARYDLTADQRFTFDESTVTGLQKLRDDGPMTIVVLQMHQTAGPVAARRDAYESAAERVIIEKVGDLVDQLRGFGPKFHVEILDVEDERHERRLKELTRSRPGLAEAIALAPESSIFFYSDVKVHSLPTTELANTRRPREADPNDGTRSLVYPGAVGRLGFSEFLQLDKRSSLSDTPTAGGNLVLLPHGREAFLHRVLGLEERRPRVGLAVIHPVLSTRETYDDYTAQGLRKSLEANGFEVVDVILKKWQRGSPPTPQALTYEENELERTEAKQRRAALLLERNEATLEQILALKERVQKAPLEELDRIFGRQLRRRIETEEDRQLVVNIIADNIAMNREETPTLQAAFREIDQKYRDLLKDERAVEDRRTTDLKVKFQRQTHECDLLIVPRLTTLDVTKGDIVAPPLFHLAKEQFEVMKEFLRSGKPVLFALGPNHLGSGVNPIPDDLEKLLPQLGIEPGSHTILTDEESRAILERSTDSLGGSVDVPPIVFDRGEEKSKKPNAIGEAFRTTGRSVDKDPEIRKSGWRPIYVVPAVAEKMAFVPEIMRTVRAAWNTDRPLAEGDYTPKFEPTKPDDPIKGTREEIRKGPFPVGVAVESVVPLEWYDKEPDPKEPEKEIGYRGALTLAATTARMDGGIPLALLATAGEFLKRPKTRVVVLGHGGIFNGRTLKPGEESLLLHSTNWLLRRDDRLPREGAEEDKWRYPRLQATSPIPPLVVAFLLPLCAIYCGRMILLTRNIR